MAVCRRRPWRGRARTIRARKAWAALAARGKARLITRLLDLPVARRRDGRIRWAIASPPRLRLMTGARSTARPSLGTAAEPRILERALSAIPRRARRTGGDSNRLALTPAKKASTVARRRSGRTPRRGRDRPHIATEYRRSVAGRQRSPHGSVRHRTRERYPAVARRAAADRAGLDSGVEREESRNSLVGSVPVGTADGAPREGDSDDPRWQ
jgi:hypothetical protein